jgi:lysophospholipase L1-like esterase
MDDALAARKKPLARRIWLALVILLVILYVAGLHALARVALAKTDVADRTIRKLSEMVSPPPPPRPPEAAPVAAKALPPPVRDYQKELAAIMDRDLFFYPLHTQFALMNLVPPDPVFFVGDSMVRGLDVSALTPEGVNLGLSGDNSAGALYRIRLYPTVMPHFQTSRLLVIAVGVNNLGLGAPADSLIAKHIRLMLASRPKNQRVVLNALFPVDESVNPVGLSGYNQRIDAINQELGRICAKFANCTFLNAGRKMRDGHGNLANRYHKKKDAFHLSPAAYAIWIEELRRMLPKPDPLPAENQQIGTPLPAAKDSPQGPN